MFVSPGFLLSCAEKKVSRGRAPFAQCAVLGMPSLVCGANTLALRALWFLTIPHAFSSFPDTLFCVTTVFKLI